jgi:hypothetical protein
METKIVPRSNVYGKMSILPHNISTIMASHMLTPMSKLIYNAAHDDDKEQLLKDLILDNKYITSADEKENENDPDYLEKLENNMLGFYMEDFVCHHFKCPTCGQKSLKKYSIKNMPVVDVICTNIVYHNNTNNIYLYQIKITVNNNNYFSRKTNQIAIGSKKYGFHCHEVSGTDDIQSKKILIGYFCINLTSINNDNEYKINKNNSFILIPDTKKTNNNKYYEYTNLVGAYGRNIIKWNNQMVNEYDLSNICEKWSVNTNDIYIDDNIIKNPYRINYTNTAKKLFGGRKKIYKLIKPK